MTDTEYRLWYERYIMPIVCGFALSFLTQASYLYFSTSDGSVIFEVSRPTNLVRNLMQIVGFSVAGYYLLQVASRKTRLLAKGGIAVLVFGALAIGLVVYSYASASLQLHTSKYSEVTGAPKISELNYYFLKFQVGQQYFDVARNDLTDFVGEADWSLLKQFPKVTVRYGAQHKILAIYGSRDNKLSEPTSNPAGTGFSTARGRH